MNIVVKVRHTEVPDEMKEYAREKIGKRITHYLGEAYEPITCEIEFDDELGTKEGLDKRVDVTIGLPHQHLPIHIEETDATFQEAIDRAVDRLNQSLEKYKETSS
jgi:ribosomal subunit interface protein